MSIAKFLVIDEVMDDPAIIQMGRTDVRQCEGKQMLEMKMGYEQLS
jgi:hypothetical protein